MEPFSSSIIAALGTKTLVGIAGALILTGTVTAAGIYTKNKVEELIGWRRLLSYSFSALATMAAITSIVLLKKRIEFVPNSIIVNAALPLIVCAIGIALTVLASAFFISHLLQIKQNRQKLQEETSSVSNEIKNLRKQLEVQETFTKKRPILEESTPLLNKCGNDIKKFQENIAPSDAFSTLKQFLRITTKVKIQQTSASAQQSISSIDNATAFIKQHREILDLEKLQSDSVVKPKNIIEKTAQKTKKALKKQTTGYTRNQNLNKILESFIACKNIATNVSNEMQAFEENKTVKRKNIIDKDDIELLKAHQNAIQNNINNYKKFIQNTIKNMETIRGRIPDSIEKCAKKSNDIKNKKQLLHKSIISLLLNAYICNILSIILAIVSVMKNFFEIDLYYTHPIFENLPIYFLYSSMAVTVILTAITALLAYNIYSQMDQVLNVDEIKSKCSEFKNTPDTLIIHDSLKEIELNLNLQSQDNASMKSILIGQ